MQALCCLLRPLHAASHELAQALPLAMATQVDPRQLAAQARLICVAFPHSTLLLAPHPQLQPLTLLHPSMLLPCHLVHAFLQSCSQVLPRRLSLSLH